MFNILSGIFSKAGNVITNDSNINPSVDNWLRLVTGDSSCRAYTARELIALNSGWTAICNGKNATMLASVPLKLYYISNGKKIEKTPYREVKHPEPIIKGLKLNVKDAEDIVEIIEHPALRLLSEVNEGMNGNDFTSLVQMYLGLIGNSYVQIVKDADGKPIELNPLLAEFVTPYAQHRQYGKIIKYIYKVNNDPEITYKTEDIIHFANFVPGNNLIGKGELEFCLSAVERYNYYDAFESYINKNNCRPDFLINYKQNLNEKDYKEVYKQFLKRFGSVKNSGKPIVTTGEMSITPLGFTPKDMQYSVGRDWARQEIAAAFGVPVSLLTTDSVNLANASAGMNQYLKTTIYPKASKYCEKLNESLMPCYDENLYIWFSEEYLEDPAQKQATMLSAYTAGVISKNECRQTLGFEPVQGNENANDETNSNNSSQVTGEEI